MALYAQLGGALSRERLQAYCRIANEVQTAFKNQHDAASVSARRAFAEVFRHAADELIQIRLGKGPITTVFEKTILYLLKRDGPMPTSKLHVLIESIHPDLCDNLVYREINGRRFGRKWKHSVRTAQTHLKDRRLIMLSDGVWSLRRSAS